MEEVKMNDFEELLANPQAKENGPATRLLASAVSDGTVDDLQKVFPEAVNLVSVSKACGTEGVDYDLIPEKLRYEGGYMRRVIRADNLELFQKYRSIIEEIYICRWASKYCARKIMTHCGLSPENVGDYIKKALRFSNKNTLLFLLDGFATREQIGNIFCHLLAVWNMRFDHSFIVDCFRSGLITLSQEQWEEFEILNPTLYCLVQDDV